MHAVEAQVLVHFRCLTFSVRKSMLGPFLKFYFLKLFRLMPVAANHILIYSNALQVQSFIVQN